MSAGENPFENLREARKNRQNGKSEHATDLFWSEMNNIIMWCYEFRQAHIEKNKMNPMSVIRWRRIFQTIELLARMREELPTLEEYFGKERKVGKYKRTISEMEAMEYISAIQDRIMEMQDDSIDPEPLDEVDMFDEEE